MNPLLERSTNHATERNPKKSAPMPALFLTNAQNPRPNPHEQFEAWTVRQASNSACKIRDYKAID
jgi:hypothetical protein